MGIPVFAGRVVPIRLRIGLSALIAYLMADFVPLASIQFHILGLVIGAIGELLCGFLLVLGVRILFYAIEMAGQLIAGEIGFAMSASFNPSTESSSTSVSQSLFYFAIVLFFLTGAPLTTLNAFVQSFQFVPAGGSFLAHFEPFALVKASAGLFSTGVQMAAPILAINFLVNIVFAVLGKAVPRMNVFITSFSVRIAAGLMVFLATVGLLAHTICEESRGAAEQALSLFTH